MANNSELLRMRIRRWRCLVQEAGPAGVELEFVAVVWVGDGDQAAGSLVEGGSAQRGDAVFGDDVIDGVFQGGDHAARVKGGADAPAAAAGGGVQRVGAGVPGAHCSWSSRN